MSPKPRFFCISATSIHFYLAKKRLKTEAIPFHPHPSLAQSLENPLRPPAIAPIHRRVAGEHAAPGPEEADHAVQGLQHQRLLVPAGVQPAEPWAGAGGLGSWTPKKGGETSRNILDRELLELEKKEHCSGENSGEMQSEFTWNILNRLLGQINMHTRSHQVGSKLWRAMPPVSATDLWME